MSREWYKSGWGWALSAAITKAEQIVIENIFGALCRIFSNDLCWRTESERRNPLRYNLEDIIFDGELPRADAAQHAPRLAGRQQARLVADVVALGGNVPLHCRHVACYKYILLKGVARLCIANNGAHFEHILKKTSLSIFYLTQSLFLCDAHLPNFTLKMMILDYFSIVHWVPLSPCYRRSPFQLHGV